MYTFTGLTVCVAIIIYIMYIHCVNMKTKVFKKYDLVTNKYIHIIVDFFSAGSIT